MKTAGGKQLFNTHCEQHNSPQSKMIKTAMFLLFCENDYTATTHDKVGKNSIAITAVKLKS